MHVKDAGFDSPRKLSELDCLVVNGQYLARVKKDIVLHARRDILSEFRLSVLS